MLGRAGRAERPRANQRVLRGLHRQPSKADIILIELDLSWRGQTGREETSGSDEPEVPSLRKAVTKTIQERKASRTVSARQRSLYKDPVSLSVTK